MSRIEYNPSLNDRVNGQLGDLGVEIQIPLSSIKELIVPPAPPAPVAPYKVFTALVTQSGESEIRGVNTGDLTIGISYQIIENGGTGWDFTNVGAPNNNIGTWFVATGITPNSWGTNEGGDFGTLQYNVAAPRAIVLENTIGNVWFTYQADGYCFINSDNLFTLYKSVSMNDQTVCYDAGSGEFYSLTMNADGPSLMQMFTRDEANLEVNGRLTSKPIEIRVYN